MKKAIYILSLTLLIFSCVTQKDITKVSIRGNTENINFYPRNRLTTLENGLQVNIKPISADSVDTYFGELSKMSGKYNYSNISSKKIDYQIVYKDGEIKDNSLIKIISAVEEYCIEKKYEKRKTNKIISTLINVYSKDQERKVLLSQIIKNPFYIDNKYLSVYQIDLINPTSKPQSFKISDINIVSGYEQLTPYHLTDMKKFHLDFENKILIDRIYLDDNIIIEPKDTITKYISTPALNYLNPALKIYINNKRNDFKVEYTKNQIDKELKYYRLHLKNIAEYTYILAFDSKTLNTLNVDDTDVLIPENKLNNEIDIVLFKKSGRYQNGFSFLIATNIKPNEFLQDDNTLGNLMMPNLNLIVR